MQPSSHPDAERDLRTMMVADHGVDPSPLPQQPRHKSPQEGSAMLGLRDTLIWCGIPVLIIALLRIFVFGLYTIPSGSMEDTIQPGDRVMTLSLAPRQVNLQRGDIVVFKDPANWLSSEQNSSLFGDDRLIKRLIGLPGDVVECDGEGSPVTINGVAIDESSYIRSGVSPSSFPFHVEVTEGHVFVMGDNRSNSADSRYHQDDGQDGLVPLTDIEGVALATYWPLNRIGVLSAHHEVFSDVPGIASIGL